MYYIGIDLGTSAVKLLLMEDSGKICNIVSKEYPLFFPHPGWSEQKPEDWFAQSMEGMKELTCRYGLKFIDYYPYFVDRDGESLQLELSLEGLHPNVFGYDKMAEILENEIDFSSLTFDSKYNG